MPDDGAFSADGVEDLTQLPFLYARLSDLAEIARLAHQKGALMSVDSTLATPVATQPLQLGADLVIHSLTKFINGHGDALGGIICASKPLIQKLRARAGVYFGAFLSAMNAWLIMRGIDTLFQRLQVACRSAVNLTEFLQSHPAVTAVTYPGLPTHPQYALARRQMSIFGAVISFQTHSPQKMAQQLAQRLKIIHYAFSLGHQRSLIVFFDTQEMMQSTYKLQAGQLANYRHFAGDGVFRLSVGLEATDDLINDLDQALKPFD